MRFDEKGGACVWDGKQGFRDMCLADTMVSMDLTSADGHLRELVECAHSLGIAMLFDVVMNDASFWMMG